MSIDNETLRRCIQVEEISGEFKIFPEMHITRNMGLGSDDPLATHMYSLKYPINTDMIIGNSTWDVINGSSYITLDTAMAVDVFR